MQSFHWWNASWYIAAASHFPAFASCRADKGADTSKQSQAGLGSSFGSCNVPHSTKCRRPAKTETAFLAQHMGEPPVGRGAAGLRSGGVAGVWACSIWNQVETGPLLHVDMTQYRIRSHQCHWCWHQCLLTRVLQLWAQAGHSWFRVLTLQKPNAFSPSVPYFPNTAVVWVKHWFPCFKHGAVLREPGDQSACGDLGGSAGGHPRPWCEVGAPRWGR